MPDEVRQDSSGRSLFMNFAIVGLAFSLLAYSAAYGQASRPDLTELSLTDLMNIEVTSVSKKNQKVSATAAAIFVITQDDIRRSGALNIPDLLRMVPGLNVAQIVAVPGASAPAGLTITSPTSF